MTIDIGEGAGKGRSRMMGRDHEKYSDNFDRIFNKGKEDEQDTTIRAIGKTTRDESSTTNKRD